MSNDPYGQYDPQQYPPDQYPPARYPPAQYPAPSPSPGGYPPSQYPPPQHPSYGGGQYGSGQYGGGQYGSGQYGGDYGEGQYGQYGQYGGVPGGWPTGSPPAPPPRRRRTGLVIGLVAGGLVLVLCLGGLAFLGLRIANESDASGTGDSPAGADGDPFADTPAADFAEGRDGIRLPEPEAVGDFTSDEVGDALEQVEEALVAARLDESMLVDHDPKPFLSLMSEDNRPHLRDDFDSSEFAYYASQFAEGAELAVPTPRVDGEITFEATTDNQGFRVIEVVTSFVWAYAFVPPNDNPELDGVVVVRDELVWQVPHRDDVREASLGLWLWEGEAYAWGIDCDTFDQGQLSPQTEPMFSFGGPTDEGEVFDPEGSMDAPNTC